MRITRWLGTGRQESQAWLGPILKMPPNAQSCLEQTGGPPKLNIPCDFILSRSPASHYSVTHVSKGGRMRKGEMEKFLCDLYPLCLLSS